MNLVVGEYALPFWLGLVVIGLFLPTALETWLLFFTAKEFEESRKAHWISFASDAGVLIGGFLLRFLIVAAAVPSPSWCPCSNGRPSGGAPSLPKANEPLSSRDARRAHHAAVGRFACAGIARTRGVRARRGRLRFEGARRRGGGMRARSCEKQPLLPFSRPKPSSGGHFRCKACFRRYNSDLKGLSSVYAIVSLDSGLMTKALGG